MPPQTPRNQRSLLARLMFITSPPWRARDLPRMVAILSGAQTRISPLVDRGFQRLAEALPPATGLLAAGVRVRAALQRTWLGFLGVLARGLLGLSLLAGFGQAPPAATVYEGIDEGEDDKEEDGVDKQAHYLPTALEPERLRRDGTQDIEQHEVDPDHHRGPSGGPLPVKILEHPRSSSRRAWGSPPSLPRSL